jgi:NACalpha-BTF3-like transcription factor
MLKSQNYEKNDKSESDRAPRVSSSVEADEAMAGGYEYYDVNEGSDEEEGADEEEGEGGEGSGGGVEATTADGKADKEEEEEEEVTEREVLFEERDVQILMDQANVSERLARAALVRHQGDMVAAVVDIQAAALSAGAAHSSNHGERDSALAAVPAGGTGGPVMHRFPSLPAQRAQPPPRPQVFGTGLYKSLWNRATADIGDDQTLSTSDVESVPGTADGQSVSDDEGAMSDTSQGGAGAALADGTDVDGLD